MKWKENKFVFIFSVEDRFVTVFFISLATKGRRKNELYLFIIFQYLRKMCIYDFQNNLLHLTVMLSTIPYYYLFHSFNVKMVNIYSICNLSISICSFDILQILFLIQNAICFHTLLPVIVCYTHYDAMP